MVLIANWMSPIPFVTFILAKTGEIIQFANFLKTSRILKKWPLKVAAHLEKAQGSLLEASLGTWDQAKPDPRCPCQARGYLKTGPTLEYPEHIFFYQLNDIKKTKKNSMILYGTLFCVSNFHCCTNSH